MTVDTLNQVLEAETVLMQELVLLEQKMLSALLEQDSLAVQNCQTDYTKLGKHLERAEEIRITILRQIALDKGINPIIDPVRGTECSQYELLKRLEQKLGSEEVQGIHDRNMQLKKAVKNLEASNRALQVYAQAQLVTLDTFLTELIPSKNEGFYGSDGRQQTSVRPRILNWEA